MLSPKPPDCPLALETVGAAEMMPGARFGPGGQYQMIGTVALGLPRGTDVLSESVRKLVRPRACAMGGAVLSLVGSGDAGHYGISGNRIVTVNQTDALFIVWGARSEIPGPQGF